MQSGFKVIQGETINITLEAKANPPQVSYSWTFPEVVAESSENIKSRISAQNSVLIINNAQKEDAGTYAIIAWNGHGNFNTTASFYLDVLHPPR